MKLKPRGADASNVVVVPPEYENWQAEPMELHELSLG
jgi:hypothetical protein